MKKGASSRWNWATASDETYEESGGRRPAGGRRPVAWPARPCAGTLPHPARQTRAGTWLCLRQAYAGPIASWPRPQVPDGISPAELAPVSSMPVPPVSPKVVALGQRLFADPRLSRSNAVACISCHHPAHSFADNKRNSIGHEGRPGQRNTPGLLGVGQLKALFWDGRAASLEVQALGPLQHADEMAMDVPALAAKLARLDDYNKQFDAAFGQAGGVTLARILNALAGYQRTLLPPATRFDAFLEGERTVLNERELLGLHLFRTKARCMTCHSGALLTDQQFHNLGLSFYGRKKYEDLGRYLVTGQRRMWANSARRRCAAWRNRGHGCTTACFRNWRGC